jgi:hypothetical protein
MDSPRLVDELSSASSSWSNMLNTLGRNQLTLASIWRYSHAFHRPSISSVARKLQVSPAVATAESLRSDNISSSSCKNEEDEDGDLRHFIRPHRILAPSKQPPWEDLQNLKQKV